MQNKIYNISLLMLTMVFFSCGSNEKQVVVPSEMNDNRTQISQEQFDQSKMKLDVLTENTFPTTVNVTGMIDVPPENRAVISATMGGYIKKTPLLIGDKVQKGQMLVTIENPEFVAMQQEYMEICGRLSYLKSEYERQQTMFAEKISSQKSFLKAESDYKTAVAKYNGLRKQLTMLNISPVQVEAGSISTVATIFAPISGSITKVHVSRGTFVSPATPIMEIVDNDHIHLELSVFEKDILNVKEGQEVDFRIPEASADIFKAEVHLVGTSIDENRTIKVHAHLENEKEVNFLTGMFVEAKIITDTSQQQSLPTDAIAVVDNQSYVLVLDEKKDNYYYFKKIEVTTNGTYKNMTALKGNAIFKPDTQFLVKGAFSLIEE